MSEEYIRDLQMQAKSVDKVLEEIKAKIEIYEMDCILSCGNDVVCRGCTQTMFKSIYQIIDKHIGDNVKPHQTGHWIDNHNGTFACDVCGCKHSKSNYCPNCGAEMKNEKGVSTVIEADDNDNCMFGDYMSPIV